MMGRLTWNYRVIRRKTSTGYVFAIHEVYYDADGRIEAITESPTYPEGITLAELKDDVFAYAAAITKPVLDYEDVVREIESRGGAVHPSGCASS